MEHGAGEESRIQLVHDLRLLDADPDPSCDALTEMAAALCEKKIALVSLVDTDRQFFTSKVGLNVRETSREVSFCSHAISRSIDSSVFEIEDTFLDGRFRNNELVLGEPHLRFYAGVPLRPIDERAVGTLCVLGPTPSVLTDPQRDSLLRLARIAEQLLRLRIVAFTNAALLERMEETEQRLIASEKQLQATNRALIEASTRRSQAVMGITHDLAAPLAAIRITTESVLSQLQRSPLRTQVDNLVGFASNAEAMISDLRLVNDPDADDPSMSFAAHDLAELVERSTRQLFSDVGHSGVHLELEDIVAIVDEYAIARIVTNLVRNALVHNPIGTTVTVRLSGTDQGAVLQVEDDGLGIPPFERSRMLEPYASLNSRGSGLGLAITDALVAAHGGSVRIDGREPTGTIVTVTLPVAR